MNRNINNVNKRFRGFFFTLDAHEQDGLPSISADAIMAVLNNQDSVENYVFQLERGKQSTDNNENGFLHYQGCIILSRNNPRRLRDVHKWFDDASLDWIHIEGQRKNEMAMAHYCSKVDTRIAGPWWSSDDFKHEVSRKPTVSQQGQRSDLKSLSDALDDGLTPDDIMRDPSLSLLMNTTGMKYVDRKYALMMRDKYSMHDRDNIKVHYLFGQSQSGKSRYVHSLYSYQEMYTADFNNRDPFYSYDYQPVLLMDEFRSQCDFSALLRMIDRYVYEISRRYENKFAAWTDVWIVSNWSLQMQYGMLHEYDERKPLYRRINDVYRLDCNKPLVRLGSGLQVLDNEFGRASLPIQDNNENAISFDADDALFDDMISYPLPDEYVN